MKLTASQIKKLQAHGWIMTVNSTQTIYKTIASNPNNTMKIELIINPYNVKEDFIVNVCEECDFDYELDSDLTNISISDFLKEIAFVQSIGIKLGI